MISDHIPTPVKISPARLIDLLSLYKENIDLTFINADQNFSLEMCNLPFVQISEKVNQSLKTSF